MSNIENFGLKCIVCLNEADVIIEGYSLCETDYKKTVWWAGGPFEEDGEGKYIGTLIKEHQKEYGK